MRKYTDKYKEETIKKYLEGQSIASISRETGVHENVLRRWKNQLMVDENGEIDREKIAMRKRIRELEMEVDVLKKVAVIFGRGS